MIQLICSKKLHRWSIEVAPAIVILILTIFVSMFLGEFTFLIGWESLCRGFLRFFRTALFLSLPLFLLPSIFGNLGSLIRRRKKIFIQIKRKQKLNIHPIKHWVFRPFQGIGIGLLFGTKLLGVLQIVTGSTATASILLPQGQFQLGRLLIVTGITILVSLVLSTLWTMDDLGIRYFNRKNYEIKMVGKYVGTLMPIVFGLYGIFSLFDQFSKMQALTYLFQMVVILYPSFTVFSVLHAHFVQGKAEDLSKGLFIKKGEFPA
ncbi:MAG TPA: hypothetical protein VLW47_04265 [Thermodesulfobacteriota bacterium]|nr:hypothetical protein [Thermodesulfobacteriota bacterium]